MLDDLPHHIFCEILFRIPVNFLVKCTCVSKTWYSLIKSPDFIHWHLQSTRSRNTHHPQLIRLLRDKDVPFSGYALHFESIGSDERFHKQLHIPMLISPSHERLLVIGYSNGIICFGFTQAIESAQDTFFGKGFYGYFLWNPSIHRYFRLPKSNYEYHERAAFEFDTNVNDFKLFATTSKYYGDKLGIEVELFSLKNHSWKIIRVDDPYFSCFDPYTSFLCFNPYTFVKGKLYFVGSEHDEESGSESDEETLIKYSIRYFNLADEVFRKMKLPQSLHSCNYLYPIQYDDTIGVVGLCGNNMELWVMKRFRAIILWMKVLEMTNDDGSVDSILGVFKGREVLLSNVSGQVYSLDLVSKKRKDVGFVQGVDYFYNSIHRYEETLVLLDEGTDVSFWKNGFYGKKIFMDIDDLSD